MRILVVHNSYKIPGGEDSVVQEEIALLRQGGLEVDSFVAANDGIVGIGSRVLTGLTTVYNPAARYRLLKKIRSFTPDVVHVHNFFPRLSPSIFDACRAANVPSVMTLHNFRIICPGALLHPNERLRERSLHRPCWWTVRQRVYRNSAAATLAVAVMVEYHKRAGTWRNKVDSFIALSDWAKSKFVEAGVPDDRITVKPSAVARPKSAAASRRHGALFVGRLDEQKGIRDVLTAWEGLDYPLRIIGDGPLEGLVRNRTNPSITYLGRQSRAVVQRNMQAASFLLLPSTGNEMFPLTMLEAFSCRLPVICSNLPSLRHLVVNGVTGLTFAPGDVEDILAKARWAIANHRALENFADRAHATYEAQYSPEANCQRLLEIYRSIIGSKTACGRARSVVAAPAINLKEGA